MLPQTAAQAAVWVFVLLFVWQTLSRRRLGWLMLSVLLYLGWLCAAVYWLDAGRMPYSRQLLDYAALLGFQAAHGFVFSGSAVFFFRALKKQPESRTALWHNTRGDVFLTLFAAGGLMMHTAFALLAAATLYSYPEGLSVFYPPMLLQLYLLDPLNWYAGQFVLMFLLYLHNVYLAGRRADTVGVRQIGAGVLLAVLWQYAYTVSDLVRLFVRF